MATKKGTKPVEGAGTTQDTDAVKAAAAKQEAQEKAAQEKAAAKAKADAEKKAKAEAKAKETEAKKAAAEKAKQEKQAAQEKERKEREAKRAEAQKAIDAAKKLVEEAKAKAKAAREAAKGLGGGGMGKGTDALRQAAPGYVHDSEHKTAGGNASVHCGDEVAVKLLGKNLDEVYKIAVPVIKKADPDVTEESLRSKYGHLNVGMQRMNLSNRMRGAMGLREGKAGK